MPTPIARRTGPPIASSEQPDWSDSDNERLEWEKRSEGWMASYERKVARCIAHRRLPTGLFPHQLSPPRPAPQPGPEPPPIPSPSVLVRPQASTSASVSVHEAPRQEDGQAENDTIIQDFTDLEPPGETESSEAHPKFVAMLPKHLTKPVRAGKRKLDQSISTHSEESSSKNQSPTIKPVSTRGISKKVKELRTIADYEKLSPRDRANQFSTVEVFAKFLNQAANPTNLIAAHPQAKRPRAFLSDLDICYLLDINVRQKLNDSDRIRMLRLSEAGAKLHSQPKTAVTSHIVIGGDVHNWKTCQKAIGEVLKDPKELQSINNLIRGPIQGIDGAEVIWVVNAQWVERCLKTKSRASEREFSIRPRDSTHAKKKPADPKTLSTRPTITESEIRPVTKRRRHVARQSSEESSHRRSSSEEIETSLTIAQPAVARPAPRPPTPVCIPGLEGEIQLARLGEDHDEVDGSGDDRSDDSISSRDKHNDGTRNKPNTRNTRNTHQTKYACDRPGGGSKRKAGPNSDICEKLNEIIELYGSRPNDQFRIITLKKACGILNSHPKRLDDLETLRAIKGIGAQTAAKIVEIANTGTHRRLELVTEQDTVQKLFTGIYGVGSVIAQRWYLLGLRTLEDVEKRKGDIVLSASQEIGLRYYDDIQERIPRQEVTQIFDQIHTAALEIDPSLLVLPMGSYRRGEDTCGDIDILITRDEKDGKTHYGATRKLYRALRKSGLITHDLSMPADFDALDAKFMGLCSLAQPGSKQRRIDILAVPFDELGGAMIYFTGNETFNRAIRLKARHLGYSLNQRGLFQSTFPDINRSRASKSMKGKRIASRTEEEIFKYLNVEYLPPHLRNV